MFSLLALGFGPQALLGLLHSPAWPTTMWTLHNGGMDFIELEAETDPAATWTEALDTGPPLGSAGSPAHLFQGWGKDRDFTT